MLTPSLKELKSMTDSELSCVKGFRVSRDGFGALEFLEPVDLRGVAIDHIVSFSKTPNPTISLYKEGNVPPVGKGLNRRARVVLHDIWPKNKSEERVQRYGKKLRRFCGENGNTFESYNEDTGTWIFTVQHF